MNFSVETRHGCNMQCNRQTDGQTDDKYGVNSAGKMNVVVESLYSTGIHFAVRCGILARDRQMDGQMDDCIVSMHVRSLLW